MAERARAPLARRLAAALLLALACTPPDEPRPVVLDRALCAHCRMAVSDLAYAAQLHTADGEIFDFDDPGCLMRWRAQQQPQVRSVWYHHHREPRWLRESEAAFVPDAHTPMDHGFAAVAAGTPGALEPAQAQAQLERRSAGARP